MRDPLPVEISGLAAQHIRELESWWRRNRIHITRIWHFLYYRVLNDPERIELLALWPDSRGEGPPI
jgi:hypothetical protein